MAKSFYNILEEGRIDVLHRGTEVTLDLPEWLLGAADKLEDYEALKAWAEKNNAAHGLLHYGIQQLMIKIRAAARPDEDTNILEDMKNAQKRVNAVTCSPVKRPGSGKKEISAEKAIEVLMKKGLTLEQIEEMFNNVK